MDLDIQSLFPHIIRHDPLIISRSLPQSFNDVWDPPNELILILRPRHLIKVWACCHLSVLLGSIILTAALLSPIQSPFPFSDKLLQSLPKYPIKTSYDTPIFIYCTSNSPAFLYVRRWDPQPTDPDPAGASRVVSAKGSSASARIVLGPKCWFLPLVEEEIPSCSPKLLPFFPCPTEAQHALASFMSASHTHPAPSQQLWPHGPIRIVLGPPTYVLPLLPFICNYLVTHTTTRAHPSTPHNPPTHTPQTPSHNTVPTFNDSNLHPRAHLVVLNADPLSPISPPCTVTRLHGLVCISVVVYSPSKSLLQ